MDAVLRDDPRRMNVLPALLRRKGSARDRVATTRHKFAGRNYPMPAARIADGFSAGGAPRYLLKGRFYP